MSVVLKLLQLLVLWRYEQNKPCNILKIKLALMNVILLARVITPLRFAVPAPSPHGIGWITTSIVILPPHPDPTYSGCLYKLSHSGLGSAVEYR